MAVRYILGRAGKGKTRFIFNEIENCLKQGGEKPLILLVPEQFTLQAERDLVESLRLPGIMRVEVLSLSRIARRVMDEVGGRTRTLLNEQGKCMVLRKILEESQGDLGVYRKAALQPGFVSKLSEWIAEMKQQDIAPRDLMLEGTQDSPGMLLADKLKDLTCIYERFNQYLAGRYIDSEDSLNLVIEKIPSARFLKGARVWIDNFTTFSSQSLKMIEQLMLLTEDTAVSLTLDFMGEGRDRELFSLSRQSYNRLHDIAALHGLEEEICYVPQGAAEAGRAAELLHLETELYAYPYRVYSDEAAAVNIFAAMNIPGEVENAALQILALARDRGYRYKDIAVVCHDMDTYGSLIKRVFAEYNLPIFIDEKRTIMENPLVELVLAAVDVIAGGYRYEDVFRYIKTGFTGCDDSECDRLENYVLRYGIRGTLWKEPFCHGEEAVLESINDTRDRVIKPLHTLEGRLHQAENYAGFTRALFELLEDLHIPDQLTAMIADLSLEKEYELAGENSQIWNVTLETFDQVVEILGDQQANLKEFRRILEAGLASCELGLIPTTVDQILVGNIQRSKSHDIKALFILGVNDGVLPAGKDPGGLLSLEEKESIQQCGLDMGMSRELQTIEENFLIYSALAKAGQYLWLSYALADVEGKALRPSLLIERFQQLFPRLQLHNDIEKQCEELAFVGTPPSTLKFLAENLRLQLDGGSVPDYWWAVYAWYSRQPRWQGTLEAMGQALFHRNQPGSIAARTARRLYGDPLVASVSRLEQYAGCPFAHFVQYGLRPQERKLYEIKAPDLGDLFHQALLHFADRLNKDKLDWHSLQQHHCVQLMDGIMDELLPAHGEGIFLSSHRYRFLGGRLKEISRRAIWTICRHIQQGEFTPWGYEVRFGRGGLLPPVTVELPDGEKVYVEGRIDRVDLFGADNEVYARVIDYKSGMQDFDLSDVYYGLSLQLLVYLKAVLAGPGDEKGVWQPAGVFYFRIDDPLVELDNDIVEEIEKKIAERLRMKGLVLEDARVIRALDGEISGYSQVIPVGMNDQDEIYRNSSTLAAPGFAALLNHVEKLIGRLGEEILGGQIAIAPISSGSFRQCKYCSYRSLCQFDPLFEDNGYRYLPPLTGDEVMRRLEKKGGESLDEVD